MLMETPNGFVAFCSDHWKAILGTFVVGILIILGIVIVYNMYTHSETELRRAHEILEEDSTNSSRLQKQLDINRDNADHLSRDIHEIIKSETTRVVKDDGTVSYIDKSNPTARFIVQAGDVTEAAGIVRSRINEGDATLPKEATEKSDRTIVSAITKDGDGNDLPTRDQKVNVYKVNLRKDHRIKAGVTVVDDKMYTTVGYEQGRFEALLHRAPDGSTGGSIMYSVAEW